MRPDERRLEENELKRRLAKIQLERHLERRVAQAKWDRRVLIALVGVFALIGVVAVVVVIWSTCIQDYQIARMPQPITPRPTVVPTGPSDPRSCQWRACAGSQIQPYQPEGDVDRFLRHAHGLGIHHQQGDGALVAAGSHMCDSVRKGVPVASVVLGNTAVMVQNGVNEKDADAFVWYAIDDLCGDALPRGGYCVEGSFWNGTTEECMTDHPTPSAPGATVTLPTSPQRPAEIRPAQPSLEIKDT